MPVSYSPDVWPAPIGGGLTVPRRVEVTVTSEHEDGPTITARIEVRDGFPCLTRLTATASDGGREIRNQDVRQVNVEALVVGVLTDLAERWIEAQPGIWKSVPITNSDAERTWQAVNRARSSSKPRHTDARLREAAKVYRDNLDDRAPTEAVSRHFRIAHRTASDYIRAARDRGFLGQPIKQGKAGEQS